MATKKNQVFVCKVCGNVVESVHEGAGTLTCCNQPMELQTENTTDAATEKHVPVIEKIDGGYKVTVGEVDHPMTEAHLIEWIELIAGEQVLRQHLAADAPPVAVFHTEATEVSARAYCNLHGLWKS